MHSMTDCDCGTIADTIRRSRASFRPVEPPAQGRHLKSFEHDGGFGDDEALQFRQAAQALDDGVQQCRRRGGPVTDEALVAAAVGQGNVRLGGRFENPEPAEMGSSDAGRLCRKGADGDQLRVGTGHCIDATGHAGNGARGHR